MVEHGTYADAVAGRAHEDGDELNWGAADSLRRLGASEQTPLLGKNAAADDAKAPVWEGAADFEGLKWWRKPSVNPTQLLSSLRS